MEKQDPKSKLEDLRRRVAEVMKRERERRELTMVEPDPPPRYDDVFFEGTAWLDSL